MKKLIAVLAIIFASQLSMAQINIEPITWNVSVKKTSERVFRLTFMAFIHPDYAIMSQIQSHDSLATIVYKMFPPMAKSVGSFEEKGQKITENGRTFYRDQVIFEVVVRTSTDSVQVGVEIEHKLLHKGVIYQPKARRFTRTLINTKQNDETSISDFDDRLSYGFSLIETRVGGRTDR